MAGLFDKTRIPVRQIATEGMLPSTLQRRLYRRRGYRIAPDVEFAPGVVIDAEEVEIGPGSSFGFGTVIRGRRVRIGRRVAIGSFCFFEGRDIEIGDDTVFREQVFVGGPLFPDSLLEVGKRVRVFQSCFLNPSRPLRIGDDTGVGGRSSIFTHGSWQSALQGYPVAFEPVTIGRNVWLPWHVFILPGVELGDNATIGAGSVVNRSVPAGALAAGVPVRVLRGPDDWPRRIDRSERWAITQRIATEFAGHLEANGIDVLREPVGDSRFDLRFRAEHRDRHVVFAEEWLPSTGDAIAVVVNGRPTAVEPVAWFALLEGVKGGTEDAVTQELETFINRFGVRFAPAGEA